MNHEQTGATASVIYVPPPRSKLVLTWSAALSKQISQETDEMGNFKGNPKYNVVSMRINDEEKAMLDKFTRATRMSISKIMREAIRQYTFFVDGAANR